MILQADRAFFAVGMVSADRPVRRVADENRVVLRDHAIVQHGDDGGLLELAFLETRGFEEDVVNLPFARRC